MGEINPDIRNRRENNVRPTSPADSKEAALLDEEVKAQIGDAAAIYDARKVAVNIPNLGYGASKMPVVIFCGTKSSGKSTAILRMMKFFVDRQYKYNVREDFIPDAYKESYQKYVRSFKRDFHSLHTERGIAPESTNTEGFLWIEMIPDGKQNCEFVILEAPGEHYLPAGNAAMGFPNYLNTIMAHPGLKRIWVLMFEAPGYDNRQINIIQNHAWARRIINDVMYQADDDDKFIVLYAKVDNDRGREKFGKTFTFNSKDPADINKVNVLKQINRVYDMVLEKAEFKSKSPFGKISELWSPLSPYKWPIIPFQAGTFIEDDGQKKFTIGSDVYPEDLWRQLRIFK